MNFNKIIGYLLLVAGLSIIGLTIFYSYNIFTGKYSPPLLFKSGFVLPPSSGIGSLNMEEQIGKEISKQVSQAIPADTLPKILNLISWSIFAGVLIFGGGQIGSLGIKMIR